MIFHLLASVLAVSVRTEITAEGAAAAVAELSAEAKAAIARAVAQAGVRGQREQHPPASREFANVAPGDAAPAREFYAYVMKYHMAKEWGVEIVHTSLAFCPPTQARYDFLLAYTGECEGKIWGSCWRGDALYQVQAPRGRAERVPGLVGEDCYEVAFFAEADPRQPAGVLIALPGESTWEYAGDFNPLAYPVGYVSGAAIDRALVNCQACGTASGVKIDFNPYTYDFIGHNCHHHTDFMLRELSLPSWSHRKQLPDDFMPEDGTKNKVLASIIRTFVAEAVDHTSPQCEAWVAEQRRAAAARAARGGRSCGGLFGC